MSDVAQKPNEFGTKLIAVMKRLLADDGCEWDRAQTLMTLRPYVIEEAHEVVDAIDSGKPEPLCEELGDLLLQVVFQAELASRKGWFGYPDVERGICDKLVRRHPHVFGDATANTKEEALSNWEAIKREEKKDRGALDGVPKSLPALLRAVRTGEKAAASGYDWPDGKGARSKVDEELQELDGATADGDKASMERELGDVLFSLANFARKEGLDPEAALRGTLDRFGTRFGHAERVAKSRGTELASLSPEELDSLWDAAKKALPAPSTS